ncbi:helix-turn-helix domain-containing protein [Paenibacillus chitinolyticus]|uniref:helix-turn-helix domain-containing protein n=1 Tax=Paenibacillus chitinolyticus TaxID=79263 RepID=UPI003D025FB6
MHSFAKRFAQLREKRGWTQDELAEKLGVSRVSISKYETGGDKGGTPKYDTLVRAADLFNVTTDYLLCRSDSPHGEQQIKGLSDEDQKKYIKIILEVEELFRANGISEEKLRNVEGYMRYTLLHDPNQ